MDQQFNNSQDEFLSKLLANPADNAHQYFNDLQRLVNDYPQSGILQALLAYSDTEKNLKQAAAYYNPGLLFKLINDVSSFPSVSEDRIIVEESLRAKSPDQNNRYVAELSGVSSEYYNGADNGAGENYFSDNSGTGDNLDAVENNGDKPLINQEEDLSLNSAERSGSERAIPPDDSLNGQSEFAPVQSELKDNGTDEQAAIEQELPSSRFAEGVFEEVPIDESDIGTTFTSEHFEPVAEDTVSISNDFEPGGLVTAAGATASDSSGEQPNVIEATVANTDTYENENIESKAGYIDDEVFDEILGIEYIEISREPVKLAPAIVTDTQPETDEETEQITAGEIAAGNFFTIESVFGENLQPELTDEKRSPDNETNPSVTDETQAVNNEQQDVAKYNDDKMPYTFMWWLEKTRQQHSGVFQPYVKPDTEEVSVVPKQETDELQQQYYENIFHITSIEEIEKNKISPPFAAVPKRKEQVIMERFIKEEPQIRPQSSDKLDNENKAKKSAEDKDELVTETLAIIYHDQMLYHKAIASYKKLMLKFPEKSGYFADKIAQVEKKIN